MGVLILLLILIVLLILTGIILPIVGWAKMNNYKDKESEGYLTGKKYLRIGLGILIFTVVAFIIGFSICLSTFSLGSMR